jgi:hypothetical protein
MESVAPPLLLLVSVKRSVEKGESVKQGILNYVRKESGEFPNLVTQWLSILQQGQDSKACLQRCSSLYRRSLLQVLERGLRGEPVYNLLNQMEEEIISACNDEISTRIARLPFQMMVPLLLFQFPAFLALLFGPLLKNFFHSLGSG